MDKMGEIAEYRNNILNAHGWQENAYVMIPSWIHDCGYQHGDKKIMHEVEPGGVPCTGRVWVKFEMDEVRKYEMVDNESLKRGIFYSKMDEQDQVIFSDEDVMKMKCGHYTTTNCVVVNDNYFKPLQRKRKKSFIEIMK